MINTKNITNIPLSKENILKFVTEEQIFRKYINYNFRIDEIFSAPYREDRKPSFGIYYNEHYNKLMFKDLSKKLGGDAFAYVQLINNNCSLWEACKIINNDFNLKFGKFIISLEKPIIIQDYNHKIKEKRIINVVNQNFTVDDLEWWAMYGISESTLNKYNVLSVKELYINNRLKRVYTRKYPIYAYFFPRTKNYKIYIPNEDKWNKWDTNANNDWDIQGYDQLPEKGETIYITKSMKDCMVLYELGLNAVATHGEGHYFNPDFFRHLKGRFNNIILFYDNDKAGKECTDKMANEYGLNYMFTPSEQEKDISDYVKKYGKEKTREIFI